MLQKAEISVADAEKKGRDVSSARQDLAQGRAAFEAKDYNMALSHATKVMRAFDPSMFTVLEKQESEDAAQQARSEPIESAQAQRARPPAPVVERMACGSCGSTGETDDTFCHNCGEPLAKKCSCGAIIKPTDKFCRKCGEKVS
jgi:membrane protease subunit (stomatin/prohibitin family)